MYDFTFDETRIYAPAETPDLETEGMCQAEMYLGTFLHVNNQMS